MFGRFAALGLGMGKRASITNRRKRMPLASNVDPNVDDDRRSRCARDFSCHPRSETSSPRAVLRGHESAMPVNHN
jgi:hypothetical protein